jgi:NAD-dependent dihydropyrimidine dehydrogenase PreA subunit
MEPERHEREERRFGACAVESADIKERLVRAADDACTGCQIAFNRRPFFARKVIPLL